MKVSPHPPELKLETDNELTKGSDGQQDPPILLSEDVLFDTTQSTTLKRSREDDNIQIIDAFINNKRIRVETDTTLFTVTSPELQIQFPDLENELLASSTDTIYNPTTYDNITSNGTDTTSNLITLEGDWFLPNSPICVFDTDPVVVPDSDFSYPSLSELPYFENVELLIQETDNTTNNSINNQKEALLDNEDTQFWSLLVGEGEHSTF